MLDLWDLKECLFTKRVAIPYSGTKIRVTVMMDATCLQRFFCLCLPSHYRSIRDTDTHYCVKLCVGTVVQTQPLTLKAISPAYHLLGSLTSTSEP